MLGLGLGFLLLAMIIAFSGGTDLIKDLISIADLIAKATIALLLVGLVAVVLSQTLEERVLIHPILVPESLSKRGYADAIVAIRLQDEINSILREVREIPTLEMADRTAEPALIRFEPPDSLSATVPGSTISLKWLLAHVRSVVGKQDQTVGGECGDGQRRADLSAENQRVLKSEVA